MDVSAKPGLEHNEQLELALEARERFLKEYPELQSFQEEIDRILEKAENRLEALAFLMEKKLFELSDSIADLQTSLKEQFNRADIVNADVISESYHTPNGYLN